MRKSDSFAVVRYSAMTSYSNGVMENARSACRRSTGFMAAFSLLKKRSCTSRANSVVSSRLLAVSVPRLCRRETPVGTGCTGL